VYESVDAFDLPISASGALFLPIDPTNSVPLLSYQHPAVFSRFDVPSRGVQDIDGEFFASAGYAVTMPDYIGAGDSPGFQFGIHAKTEAAAVIDLLAATKIIFGTNGLKLNGQLFLLGFSQGAHATLAAQRQLESIPLEGLSVTASARLAGGYDLSAAQNFLLASTNYPFRGVLPWLLAGYLPIYHLVETIEELLAPPYDKSLPPLLDGLHSYDAFAFLPAAPAKILKPEVRDNFMLNPDSAWQRGLADNDLLDWTPKSPLLLLHGSADTAVPVSVAEKAFRTFQTNGACCVTLVIDPGGSGRLDHGTLVIPGLKAAKTWFDGLVQ
jgi:pimeloyl-ACP methyl ester carboxylesterase